VWNIRIISAGRGNIKILMINYHRCSGAEKLMMLFAKVWKAEQCYGSNYSVAYRSINDHGWGATSQGFPRLAISSRFLRFCAAAEKR